MSTNPLRRYSSDLFLAPDTGGERLAAAIAHGSMVLGVPFVGPLLVLFLAPIVLGPSAYVRQQAMQSLMFHLFLTVVSGVLFGISGLLWWVILIGWPFAVLAALLGLAVVLWGSVVELIATVKAFQGKPYQLPVVGGVTR